MRDASLHSGACDAALWAAVIRGEHVALEILYDRHAHLVYSICLRVLGEPSSAEDTAQEVFLGLWRRRIGFDPGRGSFRAWIAAVARNRSIDSLRARRGRIGGETELVTDLPDGSPRNDPWYQVAHNLDRDTVHEAMATLPPTQRQVIELGYWGGLTHAQISDRLQLPLGTVKTRMRLGLEKLSSFLEAHGTWPCP